MIKAWILFFFYHPWIYVYTKLKAKNPVNQIIIILFPLIHMFKIFTTEKIHLGKVFSVIYPSAIFLIQCILFLGQLSFLCKLKFTKKYRKIIFIL
ncbi:hypothetical protein C2G38_1116023 [Gigaspora rosea]|uniref:Uncharacterized protein n=1 Tax=Gigaspora rosea TaxID=44941 RepID=A0A397W424_9GLOM|nr:hypothetical protein C2G38_1116023 [Gigaspora rosea]